MKSLSMPSRLTSRVVILMVTLTGLYLLVLAGAYLQERQRTLVVLNAEVAGLRTDMARARRLSQVPVLQFLDDYSVWDDLVQLAAHPGQRWPDNSLPNTLRIYSLAALWVYGPDGRLAFAHSMQPGLQRLQLAPDELAQIAGANDGTSLYLDISRRTALDTVLEISGRPIHPEDDMQRWGRPQGWLVVARRLSPDVLTLMAQNADAEHIELSPVAMTSANVNDGHIRTSLSLPVPRGQRTLFLSASRQQAYLPRMVQEQHRQWLLLAIFVVGSTVLLLAFLRRQVLGPLSRLQSALNREDRHMLASLRDNPDFGPLAFLAEQSLLRQKTLRHAIEENRSELARLSQVNEGLEAGMREDSLTGIANRRHMDEYLNQCLTLCSAEHKPLSIIMFDIDQFKRYNDHFGHIEGDRCLRQVAQLVRSQLFRHDDLVARYGGEEFAVILPYTSHEDAVHVAERVRLAIDRLCLRHAPDSQHGHVTISLGVASNDALIEPDPQQLLNTADGALYRAKGEGRNRVHG